MLCPCVITLVHLFIITIIIIIIIIIKSHVTSFVQEIARGVGGGVDNSINLDVHAINELRTKGLPLTNDLPKYHYTADDAGNYSKDIHTCVIIYIIIGPVVISDTYYCTLQINIHPSLVVGHCVYC